MRINSGTRLQASGDHWWDAMTSDQKKLYIEQHPNSKYSKKHIEQDKEKSGEDSSKEEQPESVSKSPQEDRKSVAQKLKSLTPKVSQHLKKVFPKIGTASSALKRIASGHELEHEHKEVLHELGGLALKSLSSHLTGSPHLGKVISQVGSHAIEYAIDKFKEHKEKNKDKDEIEIFVDGVAEGMEHAEIKDKKPKDPARSIGQHIKKSSSHIVEVLNRSFKHIKPATEGLSNLAQGKPLEPDQKKAMKGLGKVALATSIAALPGGLAVHLGAGIGATALRHAFKKIRGHEGKNILHHFVESIGEGLEDALLEHAAGGEGEHGGE